MKKTRKIAAFVAAMAMAATMAMPMAMSASATDVSVKTTADQATHTYKAYQIFTGNYTAAGLTITGWADGYDSVNLLKDDAFKTLVASKLGDKTDAASVAQAIEALKYTDESKEADALAAILMAHIGTSKAEEITATAKDLAAGYWIVKDEYTASADATNTPANNKPDAYSKYVLRVTGAATPIEIAPKKSSPKVEKKVKENVKTIDGKATYEISNTEKWNDVADYNIGDAVPFKLYGTMPSTLDDYDYYYYKFNDTLGPQFTVGADTEFEICVVNKDDEGNLVATKVNANRFNIHITVDGTAVGIAIEDVKKLTSFADGSLIPVTKDSVITVEYTATLNSNAVIGLDGQVNAVELEYSNNPYATGDGPHTDTPTGSEKPGTPEGPETPNKPESPETPSVPEKPETPGDTDKTPEDKVIVFTYEQDIKKVDAANAAPLANAVFTLSNADGKYVIVDANNKVSGWTTNADEASELKTGDDGICKVLGLDDGTYTLKEKAAPSDEYNKIENDMTLEIAAKTANDQAWNDFTPSKALTGIALTTGGDAHISNISDKLTADQKAKNGIVMAQVTNDKGITLPTTGGMGTTLFVLGGGCMAGLAGIYLISKKRTKDAE